MVVSRVTVSAQLHRVPVHIRLSAGAPTLSPRFNDLLIHFILALETVNPL